MNNKVLSITIAVALIVGGGAFYGGIKYSESKSPQGRFSQGNFRDLQNLSPEERQQRLEELGANVGGAFGGDHEGGGGFRGERFGSEADSSSSLTGEVISQSDESLTIKLSNESTKIIFVNESTQITKSVDGALSDLATGEQIFISGDENSDGSYTAQTIQLRPLDHN